MASTYELIETTTLSSSASSVTFSSITQDYRDLVLVSECLAETSGVALKIRLNGDSGSNYARVFMRGDGSATLSSSSSTQVNIFGISASTTDKAFHKFEFLDYSATDKHKSILSRFHNSSFVFAEADRYASNSAITSMEIFTTADNFAVGSSFSLYGIAA